MVWDEKFVESYIFYFLVLSLIYKDTFVYKKNPML